MGKIRSTTSEEKESKREQIIDVAASMIDRGAVDLPSMNEISKKAKVAKGTLYNYFETKEELFLEVFSSLFARWFFTLQKVKLTKSNYLKVIVESLEENPNMMRLACKAPVILENNVSDEIFLKFKTNLALLINHLAQMLSSINEKTVTQNEKLLMQSYYVMTGIFPSHDLMTARGELLRKNNLGLLVVHFKEDALRILKILWS
ncbi:TetR family transcriptional regulator [Bacteriovorax sp. Seq25_V]|uniref:TetR family transcriptional regulator n=1 Tax=Bacteriovorax sp. Seq25_V TaxID=1201288 RepID=UPI00038A4EC7|nr:TetR family transcriptional regulator [Bacteriovorax sp. Seq25_V]EQC45563.1 transcriptional regulator, TetR family [Bacteriovorax sp. Seq25_V]